MGIESKPLKMQLLKKVLGRREGKREIKERRKAVNPYSCREKTKEEKRGRKRSYQVDFLV